MQHWLGSLFNIFFWIIIFFLVAEVTIYEVNMSKISSFQRNATPIVQQIDTQNDADSNQANLKKLQRLEDNYSNDNKGDTSQEHKYTYQVVSELGSNAEKDIQQNGNKSQTIKDIQSNGADQDLEKYGIREDIDPSNKTSDIVDGDLSTIYGVNNFSSASTYHINYGTPVRYIIKQDVPYIHIPHYNIGYSTHYIPVTTTCQRNTDNSTNPDKVQ